MSLGVNPFPATLKALSTSADGEGILKIFRKLRHVTTAFPIL